MKSTNPPILGTIRRILAGAAAAVALLSAAFLALGGRVSPARIARSLLGALGLVGAALGCGALWFVRRPWPKTNGTLRIAGLNAPARIVRDRWGVPHIYAEDEHDLFFAQGYVHAQDRLWQMEFNRRIGRGTLSEVLGKTTLENDRFLRTIGLRGAAERAWERLDGETRAVLEAYAAGVNAFLSDKRVRLPLEFSILGFTPEPWTPLDTMLWGEQMSWILGDNASAELLRARIIAVAGEEAARQLMPPYGDRGPSILPPGTGRFTWLRERGIPGMEAIEELFGGPSSNQGSNNWVLHGSRTAGGKPLLANDTHLYLQMPSVWYANGLHGGRFDVVGFTLPGVPMIVIGHNGTIAWGVTDMLPDVQDCYLEKLDDPAAPARYEFEGAWRDLAISRELIDVRGQEQVELTVYRTHHGPIINPVHRGIIPQIHGLQEMPALALCWTGAEGSDIVGALLRVNIARSWDDFRAALRPWNSPAMNFVYADTAGNIGYQATGKIPIRAPEHSGLAPVCGWSGAYEWRGFIPYEALPSCLNPEQGYIVTANNKVVGEDYPYHLAYEWSDPFRAQRIHDLLANGQGLDLAAMRELQNDTYSIAAERLRPYLLAVAPAGERQARALELVRAWNLRADADEAGAAIYEVWYSFLVQNLWRDRLGAGLLGTYIHYSWLHGRMILALLGQPDSPWFDAPGVGGRDALIQRSFADAIAWLSERYGPEPQGWRWGAVHTLTLVHRPLGRAPVQVLKWLFNSPAMAAAGDDFTVNASWIRDSETFSMLGGAAQRLIVDLNDFDQSLAVNSTGQSGHAFHAQRDDLTRLWRVGEYHPLLFTRGTVEAQAAAILKLTPAPRTG